MVCEIDLRSVPIPLPTTRPPSGRPPVATKSTPTAQPQPGARLATKAPLERTSAPTKTATTTQEKNTPPARWNSNLAKSQVGFLRLILSDTLELARSDGSQCTSEN